MNPVRLCFLWHMHQPLYRMPGERECFAPWVRLHGIRSYYDFARLPELLPRLRWTVNLVPSLLEQIDAYGEGATDSFREAGLIPAADLAPSHRRFLLRNFFSAHPEQMIGNSARYRELLRKRDEAISTIGEAEAWRTFTDQDFRDLKVLFRLCWFGFAAANDYPEIGGWRRQGQGYTDTDSRRVDEIERDILGKLAALYRANWESGKTEISATPYYHPILPLLIDSDAAREAMPEAVLPARYGSEAEARLQIGQALDYLQRRLGKRPEGMWPAEGSVSQRAAELFAEAGIRWIATDEENLYRSDREQAGAPGITGPWRTGGPGSELRIVFRNREISDRIGFRYARRPAPDAVEDLLGAARDCVARSTRAEPVVFVILDGENPWETYPEAGWPFLKALSDRIAADGQVELLTVSEAAALQQEGVPRIGRLAAGSWVNGRFSIWTGGPQKNAAWEALNVTRQALWADAAASDNSRALQEILAAEGSDWFWWMDGQFATEHRRNFHDLFQAHLAAAWDAMGRKPPQGLLERFRLIDKFQWAASIPRARIVGQIDGLENSYFEWASAARFHWDEIRAGGTMALGKEPVDTVYVGFAADGSLLFRCDGPVVAPDEVEILTGDDFSIRTVLEAPGYAASDAGGGKALAVFRRVIEGRLELGAGWVSPGARFQFRLRLRYGSEWTETRPIRLPVPEGIHRLDGWSVI